MDDHQNDDLKNYDPVPDPNNVPVVYCTELIGTGELNGVINLTFSTVRFTPTHDLKSVLHDRIIASRLRIDLYCAQQLHSALGKQIAALMKPALNSDTPPEKAN